VRITSTEVFSGPNVHASVPLIRIELDLDRFTDRSPASLGDRFRRNLLALLPNLDPESKQSGFDRPGSGLALLVAEIALDLQRNLGAEVGYRQADDTQGSRRCFVVYALWDDAVAKPAAQLAVDALLQLIRASEASTGEGVLTWDAAAQRERMLKQLRPESLDLITMAMVREAVKRGIPWYRLVARKPFVQLGQGHRLRHIRESATDQTSSTGRYLSKDKNATNALLARIGVPVPAQRLVTSVEEAILAAEALGYPVVTKPLDRGNGKGVSVGLQHPDAVRWGCAEAFKYGEQVIVERFVAGEDHRILVIDGKMVAAAKRIPGHVVGDGERTIAQLVEIANADPRRGTEYDKLMVRLEFDAQAEQVLTESGLNRESIPKRGQVVPLRRTANVSTGGTCVDVTDSVHPDNREAAIRASRVLGLNIAGADFLSTDITRSYREIGGGICEVNFSPGLRPHWNANPARDVVGPIIDTMFPPRAPCRIPVAALTGASGLTETCRLVAHLVGSAGRCVGLATTAGAQIGGHAVAQGDMANASGACTLLFDPTVAAAILECPPGRVFDHGLQVRDCDVAVVLDAAGATGVDETTLREALKSARRIVAHAATTSVVLNADDSECLELRDALRAQRLCLFGTQQENHAIVQHVAAGGLAVVLSGVNKDLTLVLYAATQPVLAFPVADLPLFSEGKWRFAQTVLCAAVATAWILGLTADEVRNALEQLPAKTGLFPLAS
jgi:cyanophycin synthetase